MNYHCFTGDTRQQLHAQLCILVSQTSIGEILRLVEEANCEEFYQRYLHDFIRSVHKCNYKQPDNMMEKKYRVCIVFIHMFGV